MPALSRTASIARATAYNLLRRPGTLLSLGAAALLLLLLPRLAARALDDGAALATELTLSTIWLYVGALAALAGVGAAQRDAPFGPTPEILVSPLGPVDYLIGRALGIATAALAHAVVLTLIATLAMAAAGPPPELEPLLAAALVAGAAQVLVHVSAGLAAGGALGGGLGTVVVLAWIVAARLLAPAAQDALALNWWMPEVSRLDLSRSAAFGRPVGSGALTTAALAALLQSCGLLIVAHAALFWRRPRYRPPVEA